MTQTDELTQLFIKCCERQNRGLLAQIFAELQQGFTATEFEFLKQQILTKTVLALRQNYISLSWFAEYILFSKTLPSVTRVIEATGLPVHTQGIAKITKREFELKKEQSRQRGIALHALIKDHLSGSRNVTSPEHLLPWVRSVEPILCKLSRRIQKLN